MNQARCFATVPRLSVRYPHLTRCLISSHLIFHQSFMCIYTVQSIFSGFFSPSLLSIMKQVPNGEMLFTHWLWKISVPDIRACNYQFNWRSAKIVSVTWWIAFRRAESWKAEKVTYRWLRETYIQLYCIFWIIVTLPSNITHWKMES